MGRKNKNKGGGVEAAATTPAVTYRRYQVETPRDMSLTFSRLAWHKLEFLCHAGDTEVGAYGLSAENDLLLVEDLIVPKQKCTGTSVAFDPTDLARIQFEMTDAGVRAERRSRIWIHTHPGNFPDPSGRDEETFKETFGEMQWAIMFILAKGGNHYCRIRFNVGPGLETEIPVMLERNAIWTRRIQSAVAAGRDVHREWLEEYFEKVEEEKWSYRPSYATDRPADRKEADIRSLNGYLDKIVYDKKSDKPKSYAESMGWSGDQPADPPAPAADTYALAEGEAQAATAPATPEAAAGDENRASELDYTDRDVARREEEEAKKKVRDAYDEWLLGINPQADREEDRRRPDPGPAFGADVMAALSGVEDPRAREDHTQWDEGDEPDFYDDRVDGDGRGPGPGGRGDRGRRGDRG